MATTRTIQLTAIMGHNKVIGVEFDDGTELRFEHDNYASFQRELLRAARRA